MDRVAAHLAGGGSVARPRPGVASAPPAPGGRARFRGRDTGRAWRGDPGRGAAGAAVVVHDRGGREIGAAPRRGPRADLRGRTGGRRVPAEPRPDPAGGRGGG